MCPASSNPPVCDGKGAGNLARERYFLQQDRQVPDCQLLDHKRESQGCRKKAAGRAADYWEANKGVQEGRPWRLGVGCGTCYRVRKTSHDGLPWAAVGRTERYRFEGEIRPASYRARGTCGMGADAKRESHGWVGRMYDDDGGGARERTGENHQRHQVPLRVQDDASGAIPLKNPERRGPSSWKTQARTSADGSQSPQRNRSR